jgi:hypothetical protein
VSSAKLLISEPPLQVIPTLAKLISLNDAIVLQQLHYHSLRSRDDGWVQRSIVEWHEEDFGWWSLATVERVWQSLRAKGLIETELVATRSGREQRVRVSHDTLERLLGGSPQSEVTPSPQVEGTGSPQSEGMHTLKGEKETSEDEVGKPTSSPPTKKTSSSDAVDRPEIAALCQRLAGLILQRDPKAKVRPDHEPWRTACRRLLDIDKRSVAEVEVVIDWCQADEFWQANVLSMPTLRKQFDQLWAKVPKAVKARAARAAAAQSAPPCPGADATARARWAATLEAARGLVQESTHSIWLEPLHPHDLVGDVLVLGAPPELVTWVSERFTAVLRQAAGGPVRVVTCDRQAG